MQTKPSGLTIKIPYFEAKGMFRFWIAMAMLAAVVLRLAHLSALLSADPLLITPMVDAEAYHEWASQILIDPVGDKVFFQSPAYPYLVAFFYAIFGSSWTVMSVVQALMAAIEVGLIAWIAARLAPADQRMLAASVGAWIMALYQPLIFYSAVLLKVEATNLVLLMTLAAYLQGMREEGWIDLRWLGVAGLSLGVLVMLRGNFMLATPLLAGWILFSRWRRGRTGSEGLPGPSLRRALAGVVAFVVGFSCVLTVVMARNKIVADQWVATNATSGAVLYIGNSPYSPLGDYSHMPFVRTNPKFEEMDFRAEAERRLGRNLSTKEASKYWRDEAISYSLSDPWLTFRRALHKTSLVMESFELGDNYSLSFHSLFSPIVGTTIPWWALVLSLTSSWFVCAQRGRARAAALLLFLGVYAASLIIFFVRSRYRIPMAPLMIVVAGLEVALVAALVRAQRWKRVGAHCAVFSAVLALSLSFGAPRASGENLATWWMSLGMAHLEKGEVTRARELMKKGLELQPEQGIIWSNLGMLELGQGRNGEAASLCEKAFEIDKNRLDARQCAAIARARLGQLTEAYTNIEPALSPTMPMERLELAANLLFSLGHQEEALAMTRQSAVKHEKNPDLHILMATLTRKKDPAAALRHLERAASLARSPQLKARIDAMMKSLEAPQTP